MPDDTFLLFIFFIFGSAMLIIYLVSTANMEDMKKEAESALEKFSGKCPVCDHDKFAAGIIPRAYLSFDPKEKNNKRAQVMVFRCKNCGHLIPFANPE